MKTFVRQKGDEEVSVRSSIYNYEMPFKYSDSAFVKSGAYRMSYGGNYRISKKAGMTRQRMFADSVRENKPTEKLSI